MNMNDYALLEMKKIEKQIAQDNRKLEALRLVIKEYATEEYPDTEKMNVIILECINKHGGTASLQQIDDCIAEHQIIIPRHKLSLLLTNHPQIKYNKIEKVWKIN